MQRRLGSEKFRSAAFLVSLILASMFVARLAIAQGAPNDYQIGLPQHGEFSGTDFEHVQVNNNNLHIDLPLWSTTGRGPSVGMKYVYDSKGWAFNEFCDRISGLCTDKVTPSPGGVAYPGRTHLLLTLVGPQSYRITGS